MKTRLCCLAAFFLAVNISSTSTDELTLQDKESANSFEQLGGDLEAKLDETTSNKREIEKNPDNSQTGIKAPLPNPMVMSL